MNTVTINLGGKEFRAAKLTIGQFSHVATVLDEIQVAGESGNLVEANRLLLVLAEIIWASICRAGAETTLDEIEQIAEVQDIYGALEILMRVEMPANLRTAGNKKVN
jgi:hypothetical protein